MDRLKISLLIHGVTIVLELPLEIVDKLEFLQFGFKSTTSYPADISVSKMCNGTYKLSIITEKVVESDVLSANEILFRLSVELENLFVSKIMKRNQFAIAIHGGSVIHNGKAILVLQEKAAGKSTLIAKLSQMPSYSYMSDDLIISSGKTVLSIPLPIRLRNPNVDGLDIKQEQLQIVSRDINNSLRYFYLPKERCEVTRMPVSTILIPHYNVSATNEIKKVTGSEKVSLITNQIKRYTEVETMYKTVLEMVKHVEMYHLYYSDFTVLDELIPLI